MTMVCVMSSKLTWQEILVPGKGSCNKISSFSPVTCPYHDLLKFVTNKFNVVVTVKIMISELETPLFLLPNSVKLMRKLTLIQMTDARFTVNKNISGKKIILRKKFQFFILCAFLVMVDVLELQNERNKRNLVLLFFRLRINMMFQCSKRQLIDIR